MMADRSPTNIASIPIPNKDVSCQQLLSSSDVLHHGGLRQRQAVHKLVESTLPTAISIKWSRRYAVLHGGCLYLFKDEMSAHPLHSSTSLFGFTTCDCCPHEVCVHIPWPFKLASELETRPRVYYFSSASQNDSFKWVEKIRQQIDVANSSFTLIASKGTTTLATFGLFPADAPSAEALPLQRPRTRADSDSTVLCSLAHVKRSLPPTPTAADSRQPSSLHASGEHGSTDTDDSDGDYDVLVEPMKAASLIDGLRRLMSFRGGGDKMPHSLSSPSTFHVHVEDPEDSAASSNTSDELDGTPTATHPPSLDTISPTATLRHKPMTAVKPSVAIEKSYPQQRPPLQQQLSDDRKAEMRTSSETRSTSTPVPTPRKRTFSDTRASVEPELMSAYWAKSASEGERIMKSLTTAGAFMIRESKEPGQQTLMVRCEDSVRKYRIYADEEGQFYLDASNPRFSTCSELVRHYMRNCLPRETVMLMTPYSTVMLTKADGAVADTEAATYNQV